MIENLRITVLAENTVRRADLMAEHGLAYWIEADGHRILFDTGQGMVLRHNCEQLGIHLHKADAVALSHGHFDHTGGLAYVLDCHDGVNLFLHPAALEQKYSREKEPPNRDIGIPDFNEETLRRRTQSLTWTRGPTELFDGVYLTGEIPRRTGFEDTGGPFYLDRECTMPDPLLDDQALYVETKAGVVVVLGCAHAGVVNTLDTIVELTGRKKIHVVLGGMHLHRANGKRLEATAVAFERHGVEILGPIHCTGSSATAFLRNRFGRRCVECPVGSSFAFPS